MGSSLPQHGLDSTVDVAKLRSPRTSNLISVTLFLLILSQPGFVIAGLLGLGSYAGIVGLTITFSCVLVILLTVNCHENNIKLDLTFFLILAQISFLCVHMLLHSASSVTLNFLAKSLICFPLLLAIHRFNVRERLMHLIITSMLLVSSMGLVDYLLWLFSGNSGFIKISFIDYTGMELTFTGLTTVLGQWGDIYRPTFYFDEPGRFAYYAGWTLFFIRIRRLGIYFELPILAALLISGSMFALFVIFVWMITLTFEANLKNLILKTLLLLGVVLLIVSISPQALDFSLRNLLRIQGFFDGNFDNRSIVYDSILENSDKYDLLLLGSGVSDFGSSSGIYFFIWFGIPGFFLLVSHFALAFLSAMRLRSTVYVYLFFFLTFAVMHREHIIELPTYLFCFLAIYSCRGLASDNPNNRPRQKNLQTRTI